MTDALHGHANFYRYVSHAVTHSTSCVVAACKHPCLNGGFCAEPDVCRCPATHYGDHCQHHSGKTISAHLHVVRLRAIISYSLKQLQMSDVRNCI